MSNVSADFKDQVSTDLKDQPKLQREPTKLECGMLGALCATIVLYDRHILVRKGVVRLSYFVLILIHETRDLLIIYIASITCRSAERSDP